jgi:hypothetical protein
VPEPEADASIPESRVRYDTMKLLMGQPNLEDSLRRLLKAEDNVRRRKRGLQELESADERVRAEALAKLRTTVERIRQEIADDEAIIARRRRDLSAEYGIDLK